MEKSLLIVKANECEKEVVLLGPAGVAEAPLQNPNQRWKVWKEDIPTLTRDNWLWFQRSEPWLHFTVSRDHQELLF